jgi:hypothetical protein
VSYSFAISAVRSERIRDLYLYWMARRGAKIMPSPAEIDATEMRTLLPHLFISEIGSDPFRVLYRLVGTGVAAGCNHDFTGRYLHELDPETDEDWGRCHRLVCVRRRPLFGRTSVRYADWLPRVCEYGLLPLSEDGRCVTRCLGIADFDSLMQRAA